MLHEIRSVYDLKAVFLDNWIGQHFLGDLLQLLLRFVTVPAIKIQHKEFSLAHIFHARVPEPRKGMMDRLSLGVENRAFWHYPNVGFHAVSITLPPGASCRLTLGSSRVKCVPEAHFADLLQLTFFEAHLFGGLVFAKQGGMK